MDDGRHGFDLDLDEPLAPGTGHTGDTQRGARLIYSVADLHHLRTLDRPRSRAGRT